MKQFELYKPFFIVKFNLHKINENFLKHLIEEFWFL